MWVLKIAFDKKFYRKIYSQSKKIYMKAYYKNENIFTGWAYSPNDYKKWTIARVKVTEYRIDEDHSNAYTLPKHKNNFARTGSFIL